MQVFLITANNQTFIDKQTENIKGQYDISPFNFHEILPAPSIGITTIRNISQILSRKPYEGGKRLIVIKEMEKATLEASNAMLKILEEPPVDTFIILTCENSNNILPTIVSRCQIISDKNGVGEIADFKKNVVLVKKILSQSSGERLLTAQELAKSKDETLILLNSFLFTFSGLLHQQNKDIPLTYSEIATLISKVTSAVRYIEKNANFKATLDVLFLGFPKK